ncbi:hypothetical protein H310_12737 [Aphanomyces invadans]|uniref:Uncharacterized protein n=1 Tax=Aphanomyces invadans TaxID=157072 RepID=A0A024TG30_9STRA|nr:hypothetical protein H310_12737 [Aphanomyces invadans]ETV93125.1 hypothetical protein H310_12737 [Aphanomyces invadans]|eukprot:XP_008878147.1 hypothetical protein H310_12737 [Aphanomyces invadans]
MATRGIPRLVVVTQPASSFFKDEGGRANYLTVQVGLRDGAGSSMSVPLRITLLFESGQVVDDQDIFRVMGSNALTLHSDDPVATIHFRLEKVGCTLASRGSCPVVHVQVSRRNDGQRFKLKFDVDPARSVVCGVAAVMTTPICVMSKRKSGDGAAISTGGDGCHSRKIPKHTDGPSTVSKQVAAMQAQLSRLMALVEAQHRLLTRLTSPHVPKDLDTLLTEEDVSFRAAMMDASDHVTSVLHHAAPLGTYYR